MNSVFGSRNSRKNLEDHWLFYQCSSIYCLAVRAALWWLGLRITLKETTFHPDNKAELLAGGGKSQVPCLRIENDHGEVRWMCETVDIVRYLKSRAPR